MNAAPKKSVAFQVLRLKKAFPNQPQDFFNILMERMIEYEFSEQELLDTVNNCIDTFEYKNLTVASVLKYKLDETKKHAVID
jgi:hypothetical protein